MSAPQFPLPIRHNNRRYWSRTAIERYKQALITGAPIEPEPDFVDVVKLVTANDVAKELGFGLRTLGRRVAEAMKALEPA
jgi:hypothetical protein